MAHIKEQKRIRRKMHIRKKLSGTADRPRVYLFKSNKYIYAGASDDESGKVLFTLKVDKGVENSAKLGKQVADELKKLNKETAVFDRSGYKYHGNVKALADAMRENGINM